MTQTELAKEIGVSFATINRWETEKLKPNFLNEKKIEAFIKEKYIKFVEE